MRAKAGFRSNDRRAIGKCERRRGRREIGIPARSFNRRGGWSKQHCLLHRTILTLLVGECYVTTEEMTRAPVPDRCQGCELSCAAAMREAFDKYWVGCRLAETSLSIYEGPHGITSDRARCPPRAVRRFFTRAQFIHDLSTKFREECPWLERLQNADRTRHGMPHW